MHSAFLQEIKDDIKSGQLDTVIKLARNNNGAIDKIRFGDNQDTCLLKITRRKPAQLLSDFKKLLKAGVDPNETNKFGFTPLLAAARAPHGGSFEPGTESAKLAVSYSETLTKYGADVNQCDEQGMSPLSWAAWGGHAELVDFLISKGATQEVDPRHKEAISPLHYAAIKGHFDILDAMVNKHGFDVNYFSNQTAMHFVVQNENYEAAEKLIELGAQIDIQDEMTGRTVRDMLFVKGEERLIDKFDELETERQKEAHYRRQNADEIRAKEEMEQVKEFRQSISTQRRFVMKRRR